MEKCYCPNCLRINNHNIIFDKVVKSDSLDDIRWKENYQLIECLGCENIQFRKIYGDETMIKHVFHETEGYMESDYYDEQKFYPPYIRGHKVIRHNYAIPVKIRIVYFETLEAIKSSSYILSGVGLRALIEAIIIDQGIKGGDLKIRINKLVSKKLITEHEANRLHAIRFLGNDSVHEMEVPDLSKIEIALDIVEHLIKNLYLMNIDVVKHLDSIINDYDEFKSLLIKRVYEFNEDEEKSLTDILGKHYRRIEHLYLNNFEKRLINDIISKEVTLLKLSEIKIVKNKQEEKKVQYYKIVHEKELSGFSPYNDE